MSKHYRNLSIATAIISLYGLIIWLAATSSTTEGIDLFSMSSLGFQALLVAAIVIAYDLNVSQKKWAIITETAVFLGLATVGVFCLLDNPIGIVVIDAAIAAAAFTAFCIIVQMSDQPKPSKRVPDWDKLYQTKVQPPVRQDAGLDLFSQ